MGVHTFLNGVRATTNHTKMSTFTLTILEIKCLETETVKRFKGWGKFITIYVLEYISLKYVKE